VGNCEGAVSPGALGVHPPFRNNLTVKMRHFFQIPDILQELRAAWASSYDVLIVRYRGSGVRCKLFVVFHHCPPFGYCFCSANGADNLLKKPAKTWLKAENELQKPKRVES
jgi:hypothetical protein